MNKLKFMKFGHLSILLFIVLAVFCNHALSQTTSEPIEHHKKSFVPVFYSLKPNININPGFSISYRIPGYISIPGELDFVYRKKNEDALWFGIGYVYLIAGYHKKVIELSDGKLFVNISLGWRFKDFLGRIGFSWFKQVEESQSLEISLDTYFDHGIDGELFLYKIHFTQGISLMGHYNYELVNNLNVSVSIGIAYNRYMYVNLHGRRYRYVSYGTYKKSSDYLDPRWDYHWQFPVGCTISYSF